MAHFARFASIYAQQWGYRKELMQEAAETGHPLIRYVPGSLARSSSTQLRFVEPGRHYIPLLSPSAC
jgi:hypothetical protein